MIKNIKKETYIKLSLLFLSLIAIVLIAFLIPSLLIPILISAVIAYLFYPVVQYLEKKNISKKLSIIILYIVLGFLLFLTYKFSFGLLISQFNAMETDLPKIFSSVLVKLKIFETSYLSKYSFLESFNLIEHSHKIVLSTTQELFKSMPKLVSSLLSTIFLVPFYTFFLLKDGESLKQWLFKQFPEQFKSTGKKLINEVNIEMGDFIRARLLEATIVALIVGVGLSILQLKYFILLSLFVGIMNLIPYIGPFIGTIPGLIIAYYYHGFDSVFFIVFFLYLFAQIVDIFFIIPIVFSKIVKVHPVIVVILIILGSHIYGIVGMILAVPVFSILKSIHRAVYERVL